MMERKDIENLCYTARLAIDESDMDAFTKKFNDIIKMISIVNELDDKDIGKTYQVNEYKECLLSEDEVDSEYSLSKEDALKNAPEEKFGFFKLKRVVEA